MNKSQDIEDKIYDHCFGAGEVSNSLVNEGMFPENWVARYLSLLESADSIWGASNELPRKVVAAVHYASFYLEIRYSVWKSNSGTINKETELGLGQIRTPSEFFILKGVTN